MIILIKYCTGVKKCESFRGFGYTIIIIIIIIIIRKMYENLQATTSSNFFWIFLWFVSLKYKNWRTLEDINGRGSYCKLDKNHQITSKWPIQWLLGTSKLMEYTKSWMTIPVIAKNFLIDGIYKIVRNI